MQFQNDDMDDLLRRAAEHYPLDTSGADWNKVLNALQEDEIKPVAVVPEQKPSRRRFLWLLLLLPLGLVCNYYYGNGFPGTDRQGSNEIISNTKTFQNKPAVPSVTDVEKGANRSIIQKDVLIQPDISKNNTETIIQKSTTETGLSDTKTPGSNPNTINPQENTSLSVAKTNQNGHNNLKEGNKKGRINSTGKQPSQNNQLDQTITDQQKGNSNVMADFTPLIANNSNAGRSRQMAEALRNEFPLNGSQELQTSSIVTDHFERDFTATAKPKEQKVKKFYAGIMGGVDMTTVKFQKVENYGHDYGILLGYRLNKKWSVETGLYRSSKDYYSDGKYFSTKKIYLPPNTKITEVSGNCLMWEIPVNVKYDFTSIRKHAWFATAGLSSYIMKKEDYSYLYYYGSTGNSYTHYRSYKNASRNLFSVFQISGGYSRSIGKLGEIRIEPYLKLPIGKMGVGEMPLMSAGLHLGITRPIF